MEKEMQVLNDNTTMTIEHTIGRCDITITTMIKGVLVSNGVIHVDGKVHEEKAFYWIELKKGEWIISFCVNGLCYNSVEIGRTKTKKDAILTIIDRHTSNHWYDFGCYGECFVSEFEAQTISKVIADYAQSEFVYVREYDGGHFKAYPNGYVFEYDESIEEPENTIKSEEEAENEYFFNLMSEPEPEYIGVEYMDARRLNNWKKLLLEKLYAGKTDHDKIYCNTNYGKIFGWFWNKKGSEQFKRLYGGDMQELDSDIYFIDEMHDMFLEIICGVETDEISIESQLIEKGYLQKVEHKPEYIFDTLQSYTYLFELTELLLELKMKSYVKEIEKYLVLTNRYLLYKIRDPEKTILAFCKDMEYLTERIIADYFKRGKNNDNC